MIYRKMWLFSSLLLLLVFLIATSDGVVAKAASSKGLFHTMSLGSTTFLNSDDFYRAKNMTFQPSESAPSPVALAAAAAEGRFEGDMMIQESDENNVAMYTAKRWPEGLIPYVMEDKFTEEERAAIARGIMLLQERTCIRFEPRADADEDYVLIRRGPGCAAHVGRIGGQQWIILGDGCFGIETVTHELMHSVGFIHEQSRPDRDDHVEIIWENIKSSAKRNFRKHELDYLADHGFPYDLLSVMHYRQYAFSKNRKPTIVPKTPVPYLRCRGLDCPSELDIKKINFLYKCHPKDEDDYEDNYNRENDLDGETDVEEMLVGAKNTLRGGHSNRADTDDESDDHDDGQANSSEEDDFDNEPIMMPRRRRKQQQQFWYKEPSSRFSFEDTEPEYRSQNSEQMMKKRRNRQQKHRYPRSRQQQEMNSAPNHNEPSRFRLMAPMNYPSYIL